MKLLSGCLSFVIVVALIICVINWMFISDFIIFDILLTLGLVALQIVIVILLLIGFIYIIKELFD